MKYQKVIQKKYCCVGACIEMILNRHNISNNGQEDIAYELGLTVPDDEKDLYIKARIGEKPDSGYGTQIQKDEYSINNYFKMHNIDLQEEYYYITDINEVQDFLILNQENDILICVHCATLYDASHANWGHMVLFESLEDNVVTILDPSAKRNNEKVKLEKLILAIKNHGILNGAGFYLIRKK